MIHAPISPLTVTSAPAERFARAFGRFAARPQHDLGRRETAMPITVAFVEPNRVVSEGLAAILNGFDGIRAVAAATADLAVLAKMKPDVLVLAVGTHAIDALTVATAVKRATPASKVVAMNLTSTDEEIVEFVKAGVSGFVLRDAGVDELMETVLAVAAGKQVLPPPMTESLFAHLRHSVDERDSQRTIADSRMTPREHMVIELIGEGLSNKEIAARLNIATHTVKTHVRHVMEKLALHTRLQVAAYSHTGAATHHQI